MISLTVEITSNLIDKWSSAITKDDCDRLTAGVHKEVPVLTLDTVTGCVFSSGLMKNEHLRETIYEVVTTTLEDIDNKAFNMIGLTLVLNQLSLPSKLRIDKSKQNVRNQGRRIRSKSGNMGNNTGKDTSRYPTSPTRY